MNLTQRLAGLGILACAALSTPAQAQLSSAGLSCSNGGALSYMGAIACAGSFAGNNMNQQSLVTSQMATSFASFTGAGSWWSYVGDPAYSGSTMGHVTFTSPITGYFAIVLKSSNQFSMYLFNGGTTGMSGFNFTDIGTSLNSQGIVQGLSHASLYAWNGPPPVVTSTPEPSSIVLVASGFAGVVAFRRRRRA